MAETAIKERPILFSGEMVRAILDGRKTQTRRIVKPILGLQAECTPWEGVGWRANGLLSDIPVEARAKILYCPYDVGQRLWVQESFYVDVVPYSEGGSIIGLDADTMEDIRENTYYRADGTCCEQIPECCCCEVGKTRWRSARFMPRYLSRLTLELTDVRVERLQDISESDAECEGAPRCGLCEKPYCGQWGRGAIDDELSNACGGRPWRDCTGVCEGKSNKEWFAGLWNKINTKPGVRWEDNPWVWALTFRRITP